MISIDNKTAKVPHQVWVRESEEGKIGHVTHVKQEKLSKSLGIRPTKTCRHDKTYRRDKPLSLHRGSRRDPCLHCRVISLRRDFRRVTLVSFRMNHVPTPPTPPWWVSVHGPRVSPRDQEHSLLIVRGSVTCKPDHPDPTRNIVL